MCLAIPGEVLSVFGHDPLGRRGRVRFGQVERDVSLVYVPDCEPGDYVIVHVGFAIGKIDVSEANKIFEYLETLEDETLSAMKSKPNPERNPDAVSG